MKQGLFGYFNEIVSLFDFLIRIILFSDSCTAALGMEHGHIKDEDITASSAFDLKSVGPQNAR